MTNESSSKLTNFQESTHSSANINNSNSNNSKLDSQSKSEQSKALSFQNASSKMSSNKYIIFFISVILRRNFFIFLNNYKLI